MAETADVVPTNRDASLAPVLIASMLFAPNAYSCGLTPGGVMSWPSTRSRTRDDDTSNHVTVSLAAGDSRQSNNNIPATTNPAVSRRLLACTK